MAYNDLLYTIILDLMNGNEWDDFFIKSHTIYRILAGLCSSSFFGRSGML